MSDRHSALGTIAFTGVFLFGCAVGTLFFWYATTRNAFPAVAKGDGQHYAMLLTNGQVLFGRIRDTSNTQVVLTDVYYIQQQINPETKQSQNVLVKRGKESHAPGYTIIGTGHILLVEPVGSESSVAKLILETEPRSDKRPESQR